MLAEVDYSEATDLMGILSAIHNATGEKFFFIIDEWDAICREIPDRLKMKEDTSAVAPTILDEYVMLLHRLFKTQDSDRVFAGAYLTGILPMMRSKSESGLNNFNEYSMIDPAFLAPCFGFTENEVLALAERHNESMKELKMWSDGYCIGREKPIYNPYSVTEALERKRCLNYWASTGSYDSVKTYFQMNIDGLKDDIDSMLSGERVYVNTTRFKNDIHNVRSKDDVFTVLIHLGYLTYDGDEHKCFIPNKEVRDVLVHAYNAAFAQ